MAQDSDLTNDHHRIVILGGGTAGIITANLLRRAGQQDIAIIEPSTRHFYQPLWTLVGGGVVRKEATARREADYIPRGVRWIPDRVVEVDPERQAIRTQSGATVSYDFLVVAVGIQLNWEAIPGLKRAIDRGDASSNYDYELAPKTWNLIKNFKGGTALFHMPGTPIKCPGAPQKIMYLAADHFRRKGILRDAKVIYGSGTGSIYGAKEYAAVLNRVVERYGIDARFNHELVEILPEKKEAVFQLKNGAEGQRTTIPYDILHAVPPQTAPDFIRQSALADPDKPQEGWVKVNKHTLQHVNFPNVFALGDVAGTPNSKTGAAVAHQAPVVAANLLAMLRGKEPATQYDGYIACPIVTAYGRMLLCELDYSGKPAPRIPLIDTFKERYDMWLLKRYGLPWLYWNVLLPGRRTPFLDERNAAEALRQESLALP
ncbi:MAG TPA: FAD/NAD(P)-binding oxidoreductase [Terriglobia bacterium]|nr:FAD/NAD(P)-binding oxidoreductase [Terriglobia bacterium]